MTIDAFKEAIDKIIMQQLFEAFSVPNIDAGLNKRRHAMPQLSKFDDFMADLKENGIDSEVKSLDPKKLTPTQGNFSEEKVNKLISEKVWNAKPIVTSSDDFVIDGHHRWLSAAKIGKQIQSRVINLSAEKLLDFLKDKPYIVTKTINE